MALVLLTSHHPTDEKNVFDAVHLIALSCRIHEKIVGGTWYKKLFNLWSSFHSIESNLHFLRFC